MISTTPDALELSAATCLFRSLGDSSRLAILAQLMDAERRVVDLTEHLGLAQSTVSAHLRCLLDCGLVRVRPEGRSSVYALTASEPIREVLRAAEDLLAVTGHAVVLCPVYGVEPQP